MQKIFISCAILLCTNFVSYAQDVERAASKAAEDQHKELVSELKKAISQGTPKSQFSLYRGGKQFLLEDQKDFFKDFLDYSDKDYSNKRDFANVLKALTGKVKSSKKNPTPVKVTIDFPNSSETNFSGNAKKPNGKPINDVYELTTQAEVKITASKGSLTSVAKNVITMKWEVTVPVSKGSINTKKVRAVMVSYDAKSENGFFESDRQQIQATAQKLIEEYYQSLQGNRTGIEIPSEMSDMLEDSRRVEIMPGNINVPTPNELNFTVTSVPSVKVHVDPDQYMEEDLQYLEPVEAYHTVDLTFDVEISSDLKTGRVSPNVRNTASKKPEPKPEQPVFAAVAAPVVTAAAPVPSGEHYKVQILMRTQNVPVDNLPEKYRMDNVLIERYNTGGITYYKYVVPAESLQEAFAIKRQMNNRGIADAWIAVYESGGRIRPLDGRPEN